MKDNRDKSRDKTVKMISRERITDSERERKTQGVKGRQWKVLWETR